MIEIEGAIAVVTGGGTAIGQQIALALARAGASVTVLGRRAAVLDHTVALAAAEGWQIGTAVCDVTDAPAVAAAFTSIRQRHGRIDVLVNNAGSFGAIGPLWDIDAEEWWRDVTVNLRGPMLCSKAVLPGMIANKRGVIVNLDGGGGANSANRGGSGYGASKAGLARLTETVARELMSIDSPVQAYGLFPGLVRSEMTEQLVATPERARWQPGVQSEFDRQGDRPATDCARALLALLAIAGPDLSGRIFDVDDDFTEIGRRRREIAAAESKIMRLRPFPWDNKQ